MQRMSCETKLEEETADHLQYYVAHSKIGHTSGEEACPRKSKAVIVFWKGGLERGKKKIRKLSTKQHLQRQVGKGRQWNRWRSISSKWGHIRIWGNQALQRPRVLCHSTRKCTSASESCRAVHTYGGQKKFGQNQ